MAFYLGIDGGGTKTRCVLGDETAVLASAMTGGCSVIRVGEQAAREALHGAIRQVCETAKISPDGVVAVCVGATGAARPEIAETVRRIVLEIIPQGTPGKVEVVGDTVIALEAVFGKGPGVVVIAGTGSVAYGRNAEGQTARAGGWGYAISDEGSGYWIGRGAVAAIVSGQDQQRETALTGLVFEEWRIGTIDKLVQLANATPPPDFQRLFPVVLRAAAGGDVMANALLEEAGGKLAGLAATVVRRLESSGESSAPTCATSDAKLAVATTGSVFRRSREVRRVFYDRLQQSFPSIEVRQDVADPVDGALARARAL
jgi:N-acetylglucosamine kinase-like BadF-type ATPase